MYITLQFLLFGIYGIYGTHHSNLDHQRTLKLSEGLIPSTLQRYNKISNDYDDYSRGYSQRYSPFVYATTTTAEENTEAPIKIHQPKEDPKLYYQSEAYLKEIAGENINYEVSYVYPGREVIRAEGDNHIPVTYKKNKDMKRYLRHGTETCIRCPSDRTIIAKVGSDRVKLVAPRLTTCLGQKAPRNIHFVNMFGPKFGTLLKQGSYTIIGRIVQRYKILQYCTMAVQVIVQSCYTPNHLIANCDSRGRSCTFSCNETSMELHGEKSLECTYDMKWNGSLPYCKGRKRCNQLPPPDQGRISCKSNVATKNSELKDGSMCRIWCPVGWRRYPRSVAICRNGIWTNRLQCRPSY